MKYNVTYSVTIPVKAENEGEALEMANEIFIDYDDSDFVIEIEEEVNKDE